MSSLPGTARAGAAHMDTMTTSDEAPASNTAAGPAAARPQKVTRGRSGILDWLSEMLFGAVLVLIVAACFFGPGLYDEIMEDKAMSVLDMGDGDIAGTSLGDLYDLRGYVDEYANDKGANPVIAEKAAKILDGAIDARINGR